MDFLCEYGLPEEKKENVNINSNGSVFIRGLENPICLVLIDAFNGIKFQNRTLSCNGLIPLTPPKNSDHPMSQNEKLNETVISVIETAPNSTVIESANHLNDGQESVTSEV